MVDQLLLPLLDAPALISLAGCAFSAALCATITWWRNSTGHDVAGQIAGCAALIASQLVAGRMENGGIWPDPSWSNTGVEVTLGVLVCVAAIMAGPRGPSQESEV